MKPPPFRPPRQNYSPLGGLALGCGSFLFMTYLAFIFGMGMSTRAPGQRPGAFGLFAAWWGAFVPLILGIAICLVVGFRSLRGPKAGWIAAIVWLVLTVAYWILVELFVPPPS